MMIVTVNGIIDGNLEIIVLVYASLFFFGLLIGVIFYLRDKFFKSFALRILPQSKL